MAAPILIFVPALDTKGKANHFPEPRYLRLSFNMSESLKETTADIFITHATDGADDDSLRHADDVRLAELGYKSEFRREFSVRNIWDPCSQPLTAPQMIELIAFSFSIMGVVASVSSVYSFPLVSGGHVGMVFGWLIPSLFVMTIAASMAELASSMP